LRWSDSEALRLAAVACAAGALIGWRATVLVGAGAGTRTNGPPTVTAPAPTIPARVLAAMADAEATTTCRAGERPVGLALIDLTGRVEMVTSRCTTDETTSR
jgi:hypothetical protein